ncbi:hypothetical protein E0H73_24830 [Kribbella pittospori]|uniref:Uncharacterized protein n=1 Tax=Kribbella pittospori TaxID=722689 RepID=A0A4R0KRH6_9ACTN|nr:hypothetical protein [Kribbella pittospori]TCC58555.1 hypothetical protein E0H73_24830 [Kribbella pittospori]
MAVPDCFQCFPELKIPALVAKLKAKGWVCQADGPGSTECRKPNAQDLIRIRNGLARDKTLVGSVTLHTFSGGPGAYPRGQAQAVAKARADLPFLLAALFSDINTRAQVDAWLKTAAPTTIGGYGVECSRPSAISVGTGKKSITSWSIPITFSGRRT